MICLGTLWNKNEEAGLRATWCNAPESLLALLLDHTPEVRATAVFSLGTFINSCSEREHAISLDISNVTKILQQMLDDGSPVVRKELSWWSPCSM